MSALLRLLWRDPRVLERLQEEQAAVVARHGPQLTGAHVCACTCRGQIAQALCKWRLVWPAMALRSQTCMASFHVRPLVLLALCAGAGRHWSAQGRSNVCRRASVAAATSNATTEYAAKLHCLTRHVPFPAGAALESMPYTDAVIREGMRVHPIIMSLFRRTAQVRCCA